MYTLRFTINLLINLHAAERLALMHLVGVHEKTFYKCLIDYCKFQKSTQIKHFFIFWGAFFSFLLLLLRGSYLLAIWFQYQFTTSSVVGCLGLKHTFRVEIVHSVDYKIIKSLRWWYYSTENQFIGDIQELYNYFDCRLLGSFKLFGKSEQTGWPRLNAKFKIKPENLSQTMWWKAWEKRVLYQYISRCHCADRAWLNASLLIRTSPWRCISNYVSTSLAVDQWQRSHISKIYFDRLLYNYSNHIQHRSSFKNNKRLRNRILVCWIFHPSDNPSSWNTAIQI